MAGAGCIKNDRVRLELDDVFELFRTSSVSFVQVLLHKQEGSQ